MVVGGGSDLEENVDVDRAASRPLSVVGAANAPPKPKHTARDGPQAF